MVKSLVSIVRPRAIESEYQWLNENSELLYGARQILKDELSKHLFDCNLLVTIMGYERFYYPRIDFDDLVSIQREEDFISDLPQNYLGIPLKIYIIRVNSCTLKILTYKTYIELLNRYRQYFFRRWQLDLSPSMGEIVFDCGACIGDTALFFYSFCWRFR